ncbi:MAG TPA: M20/M25/M40 family metallo-hydrolase [Blastocatellia bacterium]|nr:M20/M25/M40 family metallo-hydrolase [Blastocatellia bacterium]
MRTFDLVIQKICNARRAVAITAILALSLGVYAFAQTPPAGRGGQRGNAGNDAERAYRTAMEKDDQRIADEVKAHSELMKNLEYLCTQIGARLTGSPQMQRASDWTLQRFKDYGIDAHLEDAEIPHGFQRGIDTAMIVSPVQKIVGIHAAGWSKSTSGEITGNVVILQAESEEEFNAKYKGKLKDAIILAAPPSKLAPENEIPDNAYDAVIPPQRGVPTQGQRGMGQRFNLNQALQAEQVGVQLRDSGKTDSLFNMGGAGGGYNESPFPSAFITHEDYSLLYRLASAGSVSMKVNITSHVTGPQKASITVAEIKGSEFPDERVIIGGHLDSWDLGQGATDNGTGSMAVLEAARTIHALGLKPKRTITFILFTGEEQGGVGVRTFITNHKAEMPKVDAVLVHDTGTGAVKSIALENYYETAPTMTQIYQPLQEVFNLQPLSTRYFGSSDHVAFQREGIPAYFCVQEPAHYRENHHSQTDTFDKVIPDQVNQGAAFLAAWAWNTSEMTEALPHHQVQTQNGPGRN